MTIFVLAFEFMQKNYRTITIFNLYTLISGAASGVVMAFILDRFFKGFYHIWVWWRSGAVVRASDFGPRGPWFEPRPMHILLWP